MKTKSGEIIHYGMGMIEGESCLRAACGCEEIGDFVTGYPHRVNCPYCLDDIREMGIELDLPAVKNGGYVPGNLNAYMEAFMEFVEYSLRPETQYNIRRFLVGTFAGSLDRFRGGQE